VRLARVTHNLLRQYMGYAYEYDAQGNTVVKRPRVSTVANEEGVLTFAYDAENRMTTAVRTFPTSRIVARYSYDAFGRRIAKRVDEQRWAEGETPPSVGQAHAGELTLFVWDGDVMVQEVHADRTVTYVYEPDSFVPLARVESEEDPHQYLAENVYLWRLESPQLAVRSQSFDAHVDAWRVHLASEREWQHQKSGQRRVEDADMKCVNDVIFYYLCDHLGTPLELVAADGQIAWKAGYRAWGRVSRRLNYRQGQPLRFQGQYEDEELGLFYNRYRYYDPDSARYLTQDPIGLAGGENLYRYVPNTATWIDPLGLTACDNRNFKTRKEAFNAAKDRGNVPRSQQIEKQWTIGDDVTRRGYGNYVYDPNPGAHGRYYQYRTPTGTVVIAEHTSDPCNLFKHFHAGEPKEGRSPFADMQGERYGQIGGKHHYHYGARK
jgi:RHS repeat-associated protein